MFVSCVSLSWQILVAGVSEENAERGRHLQGSHSSGRPGNEAAQAYLLAQGVDEGVFGQAHRIDASDAVEDMDRSGKSLNRRRQVL